MSAQNFRILLTGLYLEMSEWFVMPPKKPNKFQINNIKSGITFSN